MKKRIVYTLITACLTLSSLVGCANGTSSDKSKNSDSSSDDPIVVGSKDFTENIILAEIYALALEDAGIPVERNLQVGSQLVTDAIRNDEFDVYPEYTGTALVSDLQEDPIYDPEECYNEVKKQYEDKWQITWLAHSDINDSEGLAVTKKCAEKYNLKTISDVWANSSNLTLGGNGEFYEGVSVYPRLKEIYGEPNFKDEVTMDHTLSFTAAKNGELDVISVYTTEGSLAGDDFVIMEDDKNCWPPYYIAPIIRDDALAAHPEAEDILNKVTATFTDKNVIEMNARVDIDGDDYEDVAQDYYDSIKDSL